MRSYLIEELSPKSIDKLKTALTRKELTGPIDDIFWLPVSEELLTEEQRDHSGECGAYFLSLETGRTWVKLELLVRCTNKIRCQCIKYATPEQRARAIDQVDEFFRNNDIPV